MKKIRIILAALFLLATPCYGADTGFYFDVNPLALLSSPHAKEFTASTFSTPAQKEELRQGNSIPNVLMGFGIGGPEKVLNLGLGGGYLSSGTISSSFASLDLTPRLKISELIAMGPHIAYMIFASPDRDGSSQIDISGNRGLMSGFAFSYGKRAAFTLSIDYLDAVFDAKTRQDSNWQFNQEKINMSGMSVQLGVAGNF
ncbi:MAG: hypothetical protein A2511_02655 [Deltaproteobacteria bacterium RIFOXYD12_FULL_50_9]|nr:MAG: hypothetical protein A2511_02655 [Deltaproteobacteria bacterium RIFOXYD12_FULL_50_9]